MPQRWPMSLVHRTRRHWRTSNCPTGPSHYPQAGTRAPGAHAQCHARGSVRLSGSAGGTDRSIRVSSTSRRARFSYYCTDDMHMHIAGKLCRSHLLVRVAAVLRYACTFWRWAKGRAVEHGGLGGGRATMQVGRTQRTSNAAHTRPENAVIVAEIVLRAAVPGGEHRATDRPTRATVPDSLRAVARSQNRFGRRLRRRLRNCIPRGRQWDGSADDLRFRSI